MSGETTDLNFASAQIKVQCVVVTNGRRDERLDEGLCFGRDVIAQQFQILRLDPTAYVVLRHDDSTGGGKDPVSTGMIGMVMRVDDVPDRQLRELPYLCKQVLVGFITGIAFGIESEKRVDHCYAVVANHKSSINHGRNLGVRIRRAAHTLGPICFRRNDLSIESCAAAFVVLKSAVQARSRSRAIASFAIFPCIGLSSPKREPDRAQRHAKREPHRAKPQLMMMLIKHPPALKVFEKAGKILEKVLKDSVDWPRH